MGDSLSKVEKNLKALAKRYESVRYSKGLAILFLMLGVNAFSEENVEDHNQNQNTTDTDGNKNENSAESISKVQIKSTAAKLKERLEQLKKENEKNLSSEKLELIKLMEQGDQVVKSPWSSWQFGTNTFQDFSVGKYKGEGDKKEVYPHEGKFERDEDIFARNVSPLSSNYKNLEKQSNLKSASSNKRMGLSNGYGLASVNNKQEPLGTLVINASVKPKDVFRNEVPAPDISIREPHLKPIDIPPINVPNVEVPKPDPKVRSVSVVKPEAEPFTDFFFNGGSSAMWGIPTSNATLFAGVNSEDVRTGIKIPRSSLETGYFYNDDPSIGSVDKIRPTNISYIYGGILDNLNINVMGYFDKEKNGYDDAGSGHNGGADIQQVVQH